jgi:archaeal preflagellin peptidase FlaK
VAILVVGFAYAAVADWRAREVTDRLWQGMGLLGALVGTFAVEPGGVVPLLLWIVVAAFVLQHLFPWDEAFGGAVERYADAIEAAAYVGATVVVLVAAVRLGIGPSAVPLPVVAVLATVLFARALFELGVLYGGADAKALMIAGVVLPIYSAPEFLVPGSATLLLQVVPYSVNLLMDAALLSIVIPIGLAVRNAVRGEFDFPRGFSGYLLDVRELPDRFVWLKDPLSPGADASADAETSEEDRELRVRSAAELRAKGVERVWVTPQIPFLVVLFAGAIAALLAGNLVIDLVARL